MCSNQSQQRHPKNSRVSAKQPSLQKPISARPMSPPSSSKSNKASSSRQSKPRGLIGLKNPMSIQNQSQNGFIKALNRQDNKKTSNPERGFKVIITTSQLKYFKKKYNLGYSIKHAVDAAPMMTDLEVITSTGYKNCQKNNFMERICQPGTLKVRLNKQSFRKCDVLSQDKTRLEKRKVPNPLTFTISFVRQIEGTPTALQLEEMSAFLAEQ